MGKLVNRERLTSYGVPSQLIETFDRMAQRGAFDEEPPEELLENTLQACLKQVPDSAEDPLLFPLPAWLRDPEPMVASGSCQADPQVVYMRHHGLRHLGIWDSREFGSVREICRNVAASRQAIPLVLEVLRPPATYSSVDCEMLWRQCREEVSDLSWIRGPAAVELGTRDIVVAEPAGVFSLHQTPENAQAALAMLFGSPCSNPEERNATTMKVQGLTSEAVVVKRCGVFEPRFASYFAKPEGVAKAIAETYAIERGRIK
jgi:hypothetical protein